MEKRRMNKLEQIKASIEAKLESAGITEIIEALKLFRTEKIPSYMIVERTNQDTKLLSSPNYMNKIPKLLIEKLDTTIVNNKYDLTLTQLVRNLENLIRNYLPTDERDFKNTSNVINNVRPGYSSKFYTLAEELIYLLSDVKYLLQDNESNNTRPDLIKAFKEKVGRCTNKYVGAYEKEGSSNESLITQSKMEYISDPYQNSLKIKKANEQVIIRFGMSLNPKILKATVAALRDGKPLKIFNLAISTTFAPGELKLLNPIDPEFIEYIEGLESIANKFEGKINIFNQGKKKLKLYKEVRIVQNHYYQTINSRTTMIEMVKNTVGNISKKQRI